MYGPILKGAIYGYCAKDHGGKASTIITLINCGKSAVGPAWVKVSRTVNTTSCYNKLCAAAKVV